MTSDPIDPSNSAATTRDRRLFWYPIGGLLLLTFLMFADVLFSADKILSSAGGDIVQQGLPWREFGFGELRKGNLVHWNPHVFLGAPFVGDFQSALFYPPNWIYLLVPAGLATNWLIALHVYLSGVFMYLWTTRRGLHPAACLVAAVMLMFCGPQFLRIRAGHLPPLLAICWFPLVMLAIDEFFRSQRWGWCLLGAGALAMQILAGHPQYCFITVIAGGIYSCLCLVRSQRRWLVVAGLSSMLLGAAALAAVQLLPGMDAASESVRSAGLTYQIAATFSFPPECLITLVVPGFFGDGLNVNYWGRWNVWESSLFVGATGLSLAAYGAIYGERAVRRFSLSMVLILVLLALGSYTPLFGLLYAVVPGFDKFRSLARFVYPAAAFLGMLAAVGLDRLIRQPRRVEAVAGVLAGAAVLLGIGAVVVRGAVADAVPAEWWQKLLSSIQSTGEISIAPQTYADPQAMVRFGEFAALNLWIAAGTLAVLAALFVATRFRPAAVYGIAALAVVEMFAFAWLSRDTFSLAQVYPADIANFLKAHPGDDRIFDTMNHNAGMILGPDDVWGYDSLVPLRLAEFMAFTQGQQPSDASFYAHYPRLSAYHPLYKMLRFRYLFRRAPNGIQLQEFPAGLPRLLLLQDYRVLKQRDAILAALTDPAFDATKTVILEDVPGITRDPSATPGTVSLVEASTDHLVIEAQTLAPSILLVTDGWSKNWVAHSADESKQYKVIPANYVLRAIPLEAGDHLIRLEYRSESYTIGKWISLLALLAFSIATGIVLLRGAAGANQSLSGAQPE